MKKTKNKKATRPTRNVTNNRVSGLDPNKIYQLSDFDYVGKPEAVKRSRKRK